MACSGITIILFCSFGSGSWEISGVTTTVKSITGNYTTLKCESTHLTSFAVLVDVAGGLEVILYGISITHALVANYWYILTTGYWKRREDCS